MFWCSKKQTTVARSSTEAKYHALTHMSIELLWIHSLIKKLKLTHPHTPIPWCDNNGTRSLVQNVVFHARTKHIEIYVHFIRDKVEKGELDVRYVSTDDQLADLLTKLLTGSRMTFLLSKLNLWKLLEYFLRGTIKKEDPNGPPIVSRVTKALQHIST